MKRTPVVERKHRSPGSLFRELTGHDVNEYGGVQDVERAVEKKLGHKLKFAYFNSTVVPRRGDVFPHSDVDMEQVNAKIDERLRKLKKS